MKHLLLMRHAKSNWSDQGLNDFDRPLNERGHMTGDEMSDFLAKTHPLPDQIICSTAQRTRETLGYLLKAYRHPMTVTLSKNIYEATYAGIMESIYGVNDTVQTLMVVGHNPGMEEMAFALCRDGDERAFEKLNIKYPTAACAHLTIDVAKWSDLTRGSAFLKNFVSPNNIGVTG